MRATAWVEGQRTGPESGAGICIQQGWTEAAPLEPSAQVARFALIRVLLQGWSAEFSDRTILP